VINFRTYAAEPILLRQAAFGTKLRGYSLLTIPLLAVISIVGYEFIVGPNLTGSHDHLETLCRQLYAVNHHLALPESCRSGKLSPDFSLGNDMFSLVTMVILGLTAFTASYQWTGYAKLMGHMAHCGSMTFDSANDQLAVRRHVMLANRFFRRITRFSPFILAFTMLLMLILVITQYHRGVFAPLAPDGHFIKAWAKDAYNGWWAAPKNSPLAFAVYFGIGSVGLYIITIQNIVGLRVIYALWRSRRNYSIGADHVNSDGYYGWAPVRRILSATYCQIALHGIALAAVRSRNELTLGVK